MDDAELLRRMAALSAPTAPTVAVDVMDEEALLKEAEEADAAQEERYCDEIPATAEPSEATQPSKVPTLFPSTPAHAATPATLPIAAAVRADAQTTWCHICRADAHVWCADCGDDAFCASCWRSTHAQSWAPAELRKHRTVPCRAVRLGAALPSAPPTVPSKAEPQTPAGGRSGVTAPPAAARVPPCHGCRAAAHVWCVDCGDTAYCAKCWREIHSLLPEMRRHKVAKVRADSTVGAARPGLPAVPLVGQEHNPLA
jgi:hypothetical protein